MAGGWLVAIMVQEHGEPFRRHYYAIGHEDQAQAEWAAVDRALGIGQVAASPVGGAEPVEAMRPLTVQKMGELGLGRGEVRELGWRWPRRWLA